MCCLCCGCSGNSEKSEEDDRDRKIVRRGCTDICALLLFLVFCGGLGLITAFGLTRGDVMRLVNGRDSFGNVCGVTNRALTSRLTNETFEFSGRDNTKKRYALALDITRPLDTVWLCVERCPNSTLLSLSEIERLRKSDNVTLCVENEGEGQSMLSDGNSTVKSGRYGPCPKMPVLPSRPFLNRCIPDNLLETSEGLQETLLKFVKNIDFVRHYANDVILSSELVLKMIGLALVLSFVMVVLLRVMAPVVVYFVYAVAVIVFAAVSGGFWYMFVATAAASRRAFAENENLNSTLPSTIVASESPVQLLSKASVWADVGVTEDVTAPPSESLLLGLAIASTIITLFVAFVVWCLLPRGKIVISLFAQASRALFDMPLLLLQPLLTSMFLMGTAAYSVYVILLLHTSAEPVIVYREPETPEIGYSHRMVEFNATTTTKVMMFYQFVGFVWLSEFLLGCQRMLIAGALSSWYFDGISGGLCAVLSSFGRLVRYHLGSVALGSFIITLVRVPRYILMYIYAKMNATENVILQKIFACCICFVGCIESCLRYLSYNAYTVIAFRGENFCVACKTATNLLLDNAVDVAVVNSIGFIVLFLGKLVVAAACSGLTVFAISKGYSPPIAHWWVPCVLVFIGAYLVANCILSVYAMAVDSLLLFCAADSELSVRTGSPYHNSQMHELVSTIEQRKGAAPRKRYDTDETLTRYGGEDMRLRSFD